MAAQPAALALEGKDPRIAEDDVVDQPLYSNQVPFEAYLHYAAIQRKREDDTHRALASGMGDTPTSIFGRIRNLKGKSGHPAETSVVVVQEDEKGERASPVSVTRDERMEAQRGIRTATWISIFYLITTDILGPTNAPWAFSQLGFVPGALLFFFLGIAAFYTGMLLWHMYLKLDSDEYPVQTYSDLAERIFGKWARHSVNVLQTIQLLFNVAVIIISNTQGLSQISKGKVCFSVLAVIWTLIGMIIGQVRSLQNYGGIAHWAIWMNLLVIFITMGAVTHSAPNFVSAMKQNSVDMGPVMTKAFITLPFSNQIVGVMQMVYAYEADHAIRRGAMLFVELMAEMKRPFDFWKGMICAQALILSAYMMFGIYVYAFQGQFTINPANQGISGFGLQTATNVINLLSAIIAAGLYGNIGMKVIYINIVQGLFNGPVMASRVGRYIWMGMVLGYWAFAFIIASSIPQFSNISSIVASLCILQFSYTFPPILYVGFVMRRDAIDGDTPYTPGASVSVLRRDTWHSWSRWRRGFSKLWWLNTFNVLFFLAAGATAGLGTFSSIEQIITTFKNSPAATSFGCGAPV